MVYNKKGDLTEIEKQPKFTSKGGKPVSDTKIYLAFTIK